MGATGGPPMYRYINPASDPEIIVAKIPELKAQVGQSNDIDLSDIQDEVAVSGKRKKKRGEAKSR